MIGFYLVMFFPVLMGFGFGALSFFLAAVFPDRTSLFMARYGGWIYLMFLLIPGITVAVQMIRQGNYQQLGFRAPSVFSLSVEWSLLISAGGAFLIGYLLFKNELWAGIQVKRWLQRKHQSWNVLMEGGSSQLPKGTTTSAREYMGLSFFISLFEEFLWRAFLIYVFHGQFQLSLLSAILLSSVMFGFNHIFFGIRNFWLKTWDGVVWAVLYAATSSLLVPFLSHLAFQYFVWRRLKWQSAINATGEGTRV